MRKRKYREVHQRALRHAYEEAGVTGVPMFVIGDKTLTGLPYTFGVDVLFDSSGNVTHIYGIASHDLYHAGQIQLLKRLGAT